MIFEDQLAALEADQQADRHARREHRFRAVGGRPRRRARTGHHDRRRLPLLLHRQAQIHRRRHAGPRAIHAQHGHRRLDRRSGGDPDRCAQGRADPDPPAQLPRASARHPHIWCWRSTRWTSSATTRATSTAIVAEYRAFASTHRHRQRSCRFRYPASRATTSPRDPSATPWYTGPTLIEHLETVEIDVDAAQDAALPDAGAMGQPPERGFPRLLRA